MTQIKESVVWVTGASAGIGEATAKILAKKGAKLILSARRENELLRVKSELGLSDQEVMVLPLDMTKPESFPEAYEKIITHFGQIDILFNNAGISQRSSVMGTEMKVYKDLMDINFWSTVSLTKLVLPGMLERKKGHFVVTSSLSGKLGSPMRSGYCAAKHALHGFYDSLRSEVANESLKVSIICPGYIKTDISKNALSGDGAKHGKMDSNQEQGLSVQECASRIVKAIEKNKSEVYMGGKEVLGVYLKRFFPKLLERILLNQSPR